METAILATFVPEFVAPSQTLPLPPPTLMKNSVIQSTFSRNCSEKYSKSIKVSLNQGTTIEMLSTSYSSAKILESVTGCT